MKAGAKFYKCLPHILFINIIGTIDQCHLKELKPESTLLWINPMSRKHAVLQNTFISQHNNVHFIAKNNVFRMSFR